MGKASSSKRAKHHLTDAEKARREEQSQSRSKSGPVILDDPNTTFSLRYDVSLPGGPLRSPYPMKSSGKIRAEAAPDILRDFIITLAELLGWQKQVRASAGLIADAVNAFPLVIRQELFKLIAQGAGVTVIATEATVCKFCGVEQELVSLIDTKGDDVEEQDVTNHAPECPTHPQVDTDAMAALPEGAEPVMRPGVPVEYTVVPATMIDNPVKYRPLYAAPSVPGRIDAEDELPEDIPQEKLDEPVEFPNALPVPEAAACDD